MGRRQIEWFSFTSFHTYLGAVRFTTHVTKPYQTTQICVPSSPVFIGKYTLETTLAQAAVSFVSVEKAIVVSELFTTF